MNRRECNRVLQRTVAMAVVLLWSLSAAMAAPALTLTPHSAEYRIKISVLGGRLNTRLEKTDDGYVAESVIRATGMSKLIAHGDIRESSWFFDAGDGIRPSRFLSNDTLSKGDPQADLTFNWDELMVTGVIDGEDFQTTIDGVVHDRVSLQYALMIDLMNGNYDDEYSLQDAEKLKLLSVISLGSKSIKVPFGTFDSIGLQHRAGTSTRVTTLWLAKELDFLPVLIEQHRKGKLQVRATLNNYVPTP
jgi:hypothetical protein